MQKTIDLNTDLLGMRDISDASNRKALKANGLRVSSLGHERANNGASGYALFIRLHSIIPHAKLDTMQALSIEEFAERIKRALPYSGKHLTASRLKLAKTGNAYAAQVAKRFQGGEQTEGGNHWQSTPLQGVKKGRGQAGWKSKERFGCGITR